MNDQKILDDSFYDGWNRYLPGKDEIVWEGKPKEELIIHALENKAAGPFNLLIYITGFLGFTGLYFIRNNVYFIGAAIVFLAIIVITLPDLLAYLARKKTRYLITSKSIFFKLVKYGISKPVVYEIPFNEISKVVYEEYEDKSGVLHFMLKRKAPFKTRKFSSLEIRFHPTFESIENVIEVYEIFNRTKANFNSANIQPKIAEKTADTSGRKVSNNKIQWPLILRYIQNILLVVFAFYIIDFFVLPEQQISDRVIERSAFYGRSGGRGAPGGVTSTGGGYQTQTGLKFGTIEYSFQELENTELTITHSPVFRSVKNVVADGKSFKAHLTSDLNGWGKFIYLLTFSVLLWGRILLHKKQEVNEELLMKISISSTLFLLFSGIWWIMFG